MKKRLFLPVLILISALLLPAALAAEGRQEEADLTIYTYDSFVAEWGPGPRIIPKFEEETGYDVTIISAGDAGQVVSRTILEKDNPKADILLGIDNNLLARVLEAEILEPYKPEALSEIPKDLHFDPTYHLVPYDYGYFSVIYDEKAVEEPPSSLEDLTKPRFKDSLILMDPRTSSPGLGFLLWTIKVYGDDFTRYWERLAPSILTITEGWDAGYGLFTTGEAPLVVSYTTSPAYHLEYEDTRRYRATIFEEGNYIQVEGLGIVKGTPRRKAAEAFVDYMLSEEAQSTLPLTNWMFPVRSGVPLPDSFSAALQPEKALSHSYKELAEHYDKWIDTWTKQLSR